MSEVDIDALLEAPYQKDKPQEADKDLKGKDDKIVKRTSSERDERDSKRRRHSRSPSPRGRDGDRSKERERDRDRERDRRDRDRRDSGRDSGRDRDRERDRDRRDYRDRDYHRDSRSRRSPPRDPEREKELQEERQRRDMREERDRREREMSAKDRENLETERDSRTVFAVNLPIKATEKQLFQFFEKAGKVNDIRLITDRNSRKSKGFGYVEFADKATVPLGLALSGHPLLGQAIIVQSSHAEKNRVVNTATSSTTASFGATRLYVGSLHFNISEDDLKTVFEPFGDIEFINLHMDPETNRSKGFGFVQFKRAEDAKKALAKVNGLEIAGRQIKVGLVNENKLESGTLGELDDDDGGGLGLNAQSRVLLMAKLQRGNAPAPAPGVPILPTNEFSYAPVVPSPISPYPTPCVLLKNMFDPATETDPDFHLDIKEDAQEECSKFGVVVHAYADPNSQGHVYVRFSEVAGAQLAVSSLNQRWFAGKMISAEFYAVPQYEQKFPASRQ